MPIWECEAADLRDDPISGSRIIQLTSGTNVSNNIYGEQPYCSPDGTRIAIARSADFNFSATGLFLVFDLERLQITKIAEIVGVRQLCTNAWSGKLYYWTPERELKRTCLESLSTETVYVEDDPDAILGGDSVSPDQRYMLSSDTRLDGPGAPLFQIVRLDMEKGVREVIFEHPEICNPHLQFNPITGKDILVQNNRGVRLEPDGSLDRIYSKHGTTLFIIDSDGGNMRELPVGPPHTPGGTGHECFVGDSEMVMFSVTWEIESGAFASGCRRGNIFTVSPGDAEATEFAAPDCRFNHISASRCGKYFVADSQGVNGVFENGNLAPTSLVIGNLHTHKYRTLVQDTMGVHGGNQCTHTHPYLTTKNKHVIFNTNPYHSVPQVYAARIPDGFLESLE